MAAASEVIIPSGSLEVGTKTVVQHSKQRAQ